MLQEQSQNLDSGRDARPQTVRWNPFRAIWKISKRLKRPKQSEPAEPTTTSAPAHDPGRSSGTSKGQQRDEKAGDVQADNQSPKPIPSAPPTTVQRNPFRNANFVEGVAHAAPHVAPKPFLIATPRAVETIQATAAEAQDLREYKENDNGGVHHQEYGPVVNAERVGIAITGINYGHVTQIDEINVLRNLPIHPDITGHLSDYFPESRTDDETHILRWIDSLHPPELVLCVLGKVGVGKSTLAKHLATRLEKDKRLAANIFLGFALPDWSAESVVRMAAGQLCGAFPTLNRAVCEAIRLDVNPSAPLETRIEKLILEPIRSLGLPHPLVILLDALDQWAPHPILTKALACLTTETHLVRFVVLGRPGLEDRFQNVSFKRHDLPDVVESIMANYFRNRFLQVQWEDGRQPGVETINQLVKKASGLFIWSSTLCSVLEDELSCPNPHETLTAILQSRKSVDDDEVLAKLYHDAINLRFPKPDHKAKLKVFLGAVLALPEPLPIAAFASLVSMAAPTIRKILADLRPLQSGQMKDNQDMVYPASLRFHLSFLEYLQSSDTPSSLAFPINASQSRLGIACLEELQRALSSPDVTFTTPLQKYAMRYWPTHTMEGTPPVSTTSDAEWKATPHFAVLDNLSIAQWHRWGKAYLQLVYPGQSLDLIEPAYDAAVMPTHNGSQYFTSCLARLQSETSEIVPTPNDIALIEVVVRLQHRSPDAWCSLGLAYEQASRINGSARLLDRAVQAYRCAVDIGFGREPRPLACLSRCLQDQFVAFGDQERLAEAISLARAAVFAATPGHPHRAVTLIALAGSLRSDFSLTGANETLDESIVLLREALSLAPPGSPDWTSTRILLSYSLQSHAKITGDAESLDEAIVLLRQALLPRPSCPHCHILSLKNLAIALHSHFKLTGTAESLDEAIVLLREALMHLPGGHPNRAIPLRDLANYLESHFKFTGAAKSLDEAVVLHREVLLLRPVGHPSRALSLHNLARCLWSHFDLTGAAESLNEAITLNRDVLLLWPPGHGDHQAAVQSLAVSLKASYMLTGDVQTLKEAESLLPCAGETSQ